MNRNLDNNRLKIYKHIMFGIMAFWVFMGQICLAQVKQSLSFEQATSNNPAYRPAMLRQLSWQGKSHFLAYSEGKVLLSIDATKPKPAAPDTLLKAEMLESGLRRMPQISWISQYLFYYFYKNDLIRYNIQTKTKENIASIDDRAASHDIEPNTMAVAYTIDNNLKINYKNTVYSLSNEKNKDIVFGQSVHRNEFGIEKGTFWSDNGAKLAFYRMDQTMVSSYPLVDIDSTPARLRELKYPTAGQPSHHVRIGVYDMKSQKTVFLDTQGPAEQYLTNISWAPNGQIIYVALLNRGQNHMRLNAYSATTGKYIRTLFEEKDDKYVEPLHPMIFVPDAPSRFVWQSRKDGYNHAYLYDTTGRLIRQLSKGPNEISQVYGFAQNNKSLMIQYASTNGLDRFLALLPLSKTSIMKPLDNQDGKHEAILQPETGEYAVFLHNSMETPRTISVRQLGQKRKSLLLQAPDPLAGFAMPTTEIVQIKTEQGIMLNARIIKPLVIEPSKKYPVLVYVYGGPHAQLINNGFLAGADLWLNYMASIGFVVFTVDNRGSEARGKAFEQASFRRLGEQETKDQMLGIQYLKSLAYIDTARIGVYGWSFGGFMTTSLMTSYPKVFKAGVAGGAVIDWSLYEIMYTERYMDTPKENPIGYDMANLTRKARNLQNKLMLIHCTTDDVVLWQHSQRFVKACVDEQVQVDYFIYPDHGHNVSGPDRQHLQRKITNYFLQNL